MRRLVLLAGLLLGAAPAFAQNANLNCLTGTGPSGGPAWAPASSSNPCPVTGTFTGTVTAIVNKASTIAALTTSGTANTFTVALAANTGRFGCLLQYTGSAVAYVFVGSGAAAENKSFQLQPGQTFSCGTGTGVVITDELQIASTATSDSAVVASQ